MDESHNPFDNKNGLKVFHSQPILKEKLCQLLILFFPFNVRSTQLVEFPQTNARPRQLGPEHQQGVSTVVIQKLLEHSSPHLTNKVYTNVDPVLRHAVDQIPVGEWL